MPLKIVELPAQFRPGTSITYPPFKNGRYLEEYCYDYLTSHAESIDTDNVYIPVFWTNLQTHPGFSKMKAGLTFLLQKELNKYPKNTIFFTIVQHDDGPLLPLPNYTIVFGSCTGTIPLPLVYEDSTQYLLSRPRTDKTYLASFVGTLTHSVREKLQSAIENKENVYVMTKPHGSWTNRVPKKEADVFVELTLQSKFCLAPRGYGRSSFRFFEAMLLDVIPVYFWDDKEWLPYKDQIDYSTFAVSIHEKDIGKTHDILSAISDETYDQMIANLQKIRSMFTLEGVCVYIEKYIQKKIK